MDYNDKLYTLELDGTVQKWYVFSWYGPLIAVSNVRNAKLKDYKKYYHMNDVGKTIFLSRKEAKESVQKKG